MRTWALLLAFVSMVMMPRLSWGQAGVTSANFLKIGMGARAAAMADSFTAVSDDATAIYWNPAGLEQACGTQISLTHSVWLQGVNIDFAAISQNFGAAGAFGLGFTTLSLQSFQSTTEDSNGNFAGLGPTVNANDWELSGGYSNVLGRFIPDRAFNNTLVGLAVNVVQQNEAGPTGSALSFTGGVIQLFPDEHLSLGLELDNLGTDIQERDQPLDLKLGLAWYHLKTFTPDDKWTFASDLDLDNDTGFQPSFGTEYRLPLDLRDIGFLRGGLRTTDDEFGVSFLTLGCGLEHDFSSFTADLDYAYVPYGTLGPTHRITLAIKLCEGEKKLAAQISAPDHFYLENPEVKIDLHCDADDDVADWALDIRNAKGELVLTVRGDGHPPDAYLWRGRDLNDQTVPGGTYNATLTVKDIAGRKAVTNAVYFKAAAPLSLENVQWTLSSDAVFENAQAKLKPACQAYLTQMSDNLRKYFTDFGVVVEGHTDSNPCRLGPHCHFKNNQQLSEARAQAVKNLLVKLGMNPVDVWTKGYAETVPVATNATDQGRAQNRRIEIKIKSYKKATAQKVVNAGIFLLLNGQYDLAAQMFRSVIDNVPAMPEPHRYLINVYQKLNDPEGLANVELEGKKYGGAMPEPFEPLADNGPSTAIGNTKEPTEPFVPPSSKPSPSLTPVPTVERTMPVGVQTPPVSTVPTETTPVSTPVDQRHSGGL